MQAPALQTWFAWFLIAHALVTMGLAAVLTPAPGAPRTPFFPAWWRAAVDGAWPVSRLGVKPAPARVVGCALCLAAFTLLADAGLGLLGIPGLHGFWQELAALGAGASLVLLGLYWHPWLAVGALLNIGILAGVYAGWFSRWFPR